MRYLHFILATLLAPVAFNAMAESSHTMNHSQHMATMAEPHSVNPQEAGQAGFAAIAEVVKLLESDADTDWSTVNINALREHLLDMNHLVMGAAVEEQAIDGGMRFNVTGQGKVLNAIHNMVPAHTNELNKMPDFSATTESIEQGTALIITSNDETTIAKIKGLGFFGLMAIGSHHQAHHYMMATGKNHKTLAKPIAVKSYGKYKRMIHMKDSTGVVKLTDALSSDHLFAVGAVQHGLGEITVVDGKPYLDYGDDGIGNSKNVIPSDEQAVLLVTAEVKQWQSIKIPDFLSQDKLFEVILSKAKEHGLDVEKPFPFMLEGGFKELKVHVINGRNPKFAGHGSKEKFFHSAVATKTHQSASVVGFYSASNQGIYTHPGESWHLHAIIKENNASVHVDGIHTGHTTLRLPAVKY